MKLVPLLSATAVALSALPALAAEDAELREEAQFYFEAIPTEISVIKQTEDQPEGVPLTSEKIELGRWLFFDPRMSSSGLISCQTCHNVGLGGVDGLAVSIGHGWQSGPRNSPTMLNAIFNAAQFWDGRAADLAEQAKGPVQASVEMSNTPDAVVETLNSMPEYVEAFQTAFPGDNDPVNFDNFAEAIEQFEATLITPNSKFDLFLNGDDDAMSEQEKRGLQAFMETGCTACHYGVNFGGQDYHPFGVIARPGAEVLPAGDRGRFEVTQTVDDEYVFRASPLRNIALTAPYFHSGVVWDLKEAVQIMSSSQLGTELSDEQVDDIVAFLHTLTGDQPEVVHPILPMRRDETPLPAPM
ncbi:cytochrome-c peroxidase [uncultured Paracoccus sp.]|uniref:cytochrome-c peroxidase n=1 Tax=uncultured Paracoccus sp. TaxID=189685 RepID=UPI0025F73300|nr:cytochrome-c peroxidase [uncultured Paracoccus sp.]